MSRFGRRGVRRSFATAFALILVLAATTLSSAPAQAATTPPVDTSYVEGKDIQAFLFNPLVVNSFALSMTEIDLAALNNAPREYARATLVVTTAKGTTRSLVVGVHIKGMLGSFRGLDVKAGFKIKMNEYVSGQTLYGVKKFTLNNMVQDPTMLREAVTYRLFRAMGVPAPRVGYATVTLNGRNYGLHANIETYDDTMFSRWYSAGTKHLYEGGYGTEVGPGMQVDEGSTTDLADVTELQTMNNLTGEEWFNAIRTRVDLSEMMMDWAVEHYVSHWDGYTRRWPNNYFVHKQKNGMFTMHPWGTDQTWNPYQWTALIDDGATMMTRCIFYQPCNDLYVAALGKIRVKVPTLDLQGMVDKVWAKISSSVQSDPLKEASYDQAVEYKNLAKTFIGTRFGELTTLLGARSSSTLRVAYPVAGFAPGAMFRPTLFKTGDGTLSFVRLQGTGICEVSDSTGSVTILRPGTCQIGVQLSKTDSKHAEMLTITREIPVMTSRILVASFGSVPKGQTLAISATADSTNTVRARLLSGSCRVVGLSVTALASSGSCKVTLSVAGDGTFYGSSRVITVTMRRAVAPG